MSFLTPKIICTFTSGMLNDKEVNFADKLHSQIPTTLADANCNYSLSDDEEEQENTQQFNGCLNKWTNYLHGWQKRFFILRGATLAYYKSENDTSFGCRGAISIGRALIQPHEFDDCRFDVSLNDCVWYLRAESAEMRQKWIETLETCKAESGYGSQNDLRRHGSLISVASNRSLTSSSSFKKAQGLKAKLAELETFRDIVCKQIETLQAFFDNQCTVSSASRSDAASSKIPEFYNMEKDFEAVSLNSKNCENKMLSENMAAQKQTVLDFKGEALTFKATTAGILSTLQHCIELMQHRDDAWRKRLDREIEKRKKLEDSIKQSTFPQKHIRITDGPDYEEGPHSALNEEEWHDAVDAALERRDIEDRRVTRLLCRETEHPVVKHFDKILLDRSHSLYDEIDRYTCEQVMYARAGVEQGIWQLFAEEGQMKMYKREVEIDGLVCDPLKAVHSVKGVSAREYLHYFFEPEYKMDWDTTLEFMTVVERPTDDTCVVHQVHKRVWPASQRESLFWSHFRRLDLEPHPTQTTDAAADSAAATGPAAEYLLDCYVVCNHDTTHNDVPSTKNIRVGLTVAMLCQTVSSRPVKDLSSLRREELTTKIIYVAQVNPGGWAPSSVLRAVYKREYPKFLKRFTHYVLQKIENTPIRF